MITFEMILQAIMITTALSMDCLVSGFAYGINKIKMPFLSVMIINLVCSAVLGISLFLGSIIGKYVPQIITLVLCVTILIVMGLIKILDSVVKSQVKKKKGIDKEIKFSFFNLKFIINILASPEDADIDKSKSLSPKEALVLAIALSLDGLAVGLGTGLISQSTISYIVIIAFSLITGTFFLILGRLIGKKIAQKTSLNLSWISGVLLIGIAIMKIFI